MAEAPQAYEGMPHFFGRCAQNFRKVLREILSPQILAGSRNALPYFDRPASAGEATDT